MPMSNEELVRKNHPNSTEFKVEKLEELCKRLERTVLLLERRLRELELENHRLSTEAR
jgi:hypothetical protein